MLLKRLTRLNATPEVDIAQINKVTWRRYAAPEM